MDAYIGTILPWPIAWAPRGWAFCDGTQLNVTQNQALFVLLGSRYGGDGRTTFNLPDLRGRIPMGMAAAAGLNPLGFTAGGNTATVTGTATGAMAVQPQNLPPHDHPATLSLSGLTGKTGISVSTGTNGAVTAGANSVLSMTADSGPTSAAIFLASSTTPTAPVNLGGVSTTVSGSGTVTVDANTGGGQALPVSLAVNGTVGSTLPPFLALNYIICLLGIYPTRN